MPDFFHIWIRPKPGLGRWDVEERIGGAIDWYRYAPNSYVVYTTADLNKWQTRLLPLVEPNKADPGSGLLFISRLDVNQKQGYMTQEFWDWFNKDRDR